MADNSESKSRSILDHPVQNPLFDEVEEAIPSMLDQFEYEQTTNFTTGLECLAVGIAKLLPSDIRNSYEGVHGTMNEGNGAKPYNVH